MVLEYTVVEGAFEEAGAPVYAKLFPTALELFRAGQWQQAESTLARCLEILPDDSPSLFYLELCRTYQRKPPPTDRQGVIPEGK